MIRFFIVFIIIIFQFEYASTQDTTAVKSSKVKTGYITGGALIVTGLILNKESIKTDVREWVRDRYDIPNTSVDDILQHVPIAMIYATDLALGNDKKEIGRHTRHLIVSQAMTLGTMLITKEITNSPRPNDGSHTFPSGHTAYSFASAGVMYHSFKDDNLWLAYSGYVPAAVVGVYRVIKDKHWVSDVVVGAGLGIVMSHLSYHMDIWHSRTDKRDKGHTSVNVRLGMTPAGLGLSATF